MKYSYNWLKDYIRGRLPKPDKLAELLTMHAFEVESVTKRGSDFVLDIDVLPNRACDCLSHIGVARECCALLNYKLQITNYKQIPNSKFQKLKEDKKLKINKFLRVEVKDKKLCPRYTARLISDVKVKDSPVWIKKRLLACGIKPINNIVDATNYVMLETGQPLHAFDLDKIESGNSKSNTGIANFSSRSNRGLKSATSQKFKKIIVRRAKKGEKITILDGEEYELDRDVLVIADSPRPSGRGKEEPLAIAGIKGGKKAEIDGSTKTIILESANFDPLAIRRASKKLSVKSDASRRFEAGLDPNICEWALTRVASLIQRISRGEIAKGVIDKYSKKKKPVKIKLDLKKVEDLLGVDFPRGKIRDIFKHLGFNIRQHKFNFEVEIPTWRGDLNICQDLIEEVARIYGYNNISSQMPEVQLDIPKIDIGFFWENKIKDILVGAGFTEVYNYSFVNADQTQILNANQTLIQVANPMNINQKYLRPTLIPNLLIDIKENLKNFESFRIFELGKIYYQEEKTVQEKRSLTGAIVSDKAQGFYRAKGVIELLLNKLGIKKINLEPYTLNLKPSYWHPSRTAEIKVGRKILGTIGEVHPEIKACYDKDLRVTLFNLDFELLIKLAKLTKIYKPVSRYPAVTLDLAVIVNKHFLWRNIRDRVLKEAGGLVKDVRLFDIYKGKGIPKGKISFAFHVTYQKEGETLTERETILVHEKIIRVLERMGGEIRR